MTQPRTRTIVANELLHHALEWAPAGQSHEQTAGEPAAPVALLVHGYMDAAGTWDLVAPALCAAGLRVIAPDMRGFGAGPRAPSGSYYHFPDYIADLAEIVDGLGLDAPFYLVGHSMGGSIATYYAGAFPGRVAKLALLEGVGPPDNPIDVAPDRMRRWLEDVRAVRGKRATARTSFPAEDAYRRLVLNHPHVDPAVLRNRLAHLVRDVGDGMVEWKFDPMHKTIAPMPFSARYFLSFAERIACPVLAVGGGATGFHPPDEAERLAAFRDVTRVEIDGAGHMMHWSRPEQLGAHLVDFWRA